MEQHLITNGDDTYLIKAKINEVLSADRSYYLLTDGNDENVVACDALHEIINDGVYFSDITNDLGVQPYQASVKLYTDSRSEADTVELYNSIAPQCLELNALGMVPFITLPETDEACPAERIAKLNNAAGYWQRAIAMFEQSDDAENGELFHVTVHLSGVLFTKRLNDVKSSDDVRDKYRVACRINQDALDGNTVMMTLYDLIEV